MRVLLVASLAVAAIVAINTSCNNCPTTGGANGSLYCHPAACAANETECNGACTNLQYDRDNCASCGHTCGDGLSCSQGQCVEACPDPTQTRCNGVCVDLTSDSNNCNACQNACTNGNSCANSSCVCASGVTCVGQCVDPNTSNLYCGATGNCSGTNSGRQCATNEACNNGTCRSSLIYRGTLPPTPPNNTTGAYTGHFTFMSVDGIAGANAYCQSLFGDANNPNDVVAMCTYSQLMAASMTTPAETANAHPYNTTTTITDWWVDDPNDANDPNQPNATRCGDQVNYANKPWTYATAHLGNVGEYATLLSETTGQVGGLIKGTPDRPGPVSVNVAECNVARFVPCCTQ